MNQKQYLNPLHKKKSKKKKNQIKKGLYIHVTNIYRSVFWCINRLRRFINVNIRDDQKQDTQILIQQISNIIDLKGNELSVKKKEKN